MSADMYVSAEKQFYIVFNLYTFLYWMHFDHVIIKKYNESDLLQKEVRIKKINDAKWNFKIS